VQLIVGARLRSVSSQFEAAPRDQAVDHCPGGVPVFSAHIQLPVHNQSGDFLA
jgi:hypothetical protein